MGEVIGVVGAVDVTVQYQSQKAQANHVIVEGGGVGGEPHGMRLAATLLYGLGTTT